MAENAAAATDFAALDARSHDLKRQLQQLKAQKKGEARKKGSNRQDIIPSGIMSAGAVWLTHGSSSAILEAVWRGPGHGGAQNR